MMLAHAVDHHDEMTLAEDEVQEGDCVVLATGLVTQQLKTEFVDLVGRKFKQGAKSLDGWLSVADPVIFILPEGNPSTTRTGTAPTT